MYCFLLEICCFQSSLITTRCHLYKVLTRKFGSGVGNKQIRGGTAKILIQLSSVARRYTDISKVRAGVHFMRLYGDGFCDLFGGSTKCGSYLSIIVVETEGYAWLSKFFQIGIQGQLGSFKFSGVFGSVFLRL